MHLYTISFTKFYQLGAPLAKSYFLLKSSALCIMTSRILSYSSRREEDEAFILPKVMIMPLVRDLSSSFELLKFLPEFEIGVSKD